MTPSPHSHPIPPARIWALMPCAGVGERALTASRTGPKQYQMVAGRPLIAHTLAALQAVPAIHHTLIAIAAGDRFWSDDCPIERNPRWSTAPCGGPTRAATVTAGLAVLRQLGASDGDWVLVHDAARCLVQPAWVERLIAECASDAVGGLLAAPLADTLKSSQGTASTTPRVSATLDRAHKWLAQTPQMFRLGLLEKALLAAGSAVTDEASAIETLGLAPRLIASSAENFKVTYPEDFELAEIILQGRKTSSPIV